MVEFQGEDIKYGNVNVKKSIYECPCPGVVISCDYCNFEIEGCMVLGALEIECLCRFKIIVKYIPEDNYDPPK